MSHPRTAAEVRERFLRFFEERGHQRVRSASLVPAGDPTLLFVNAGMVPFKDVFTGRERRDYVRATSTQKCVRAGGKHNDLDNVGFTARHHTFFEMLGNFSFGDYFKKEAIESAWELVTKVFGIDPERLRVTVFEGGDGMPADEEAEALWYAAGVPEGRVERLGAADNFWAMGDTGPCGPCSEVHYHQGDDVPCAEVEAGRACKGVACDCDRWLEIWNLVFMQFDRADRDAPLVPLPRPSVDTGAGLERVVAVLQGKASNYDTDLFTPMLARIGELTGKPYAEADADAKASMRVIADHARATAFLIADGVQPSNEGRGYVLRRIMRRAIRHGSKLGLDRVFFPEVVERVIETMADAYPELGDGRSFVLQATRHEEESFRRTLERGLKLIDDETARLQREGGERIPGDVVFFLHGTHGFPWDLTQVIAKERGLDIDLEGYEARMADERDRASFSSGEKAAGGELHRVLEAVGPTTFLGYDGEGHEGEGTLRAILRDGVEVAEANPGETVTLVFDRTPFYGESGGQLGDTGEARSSGGKVRVAILDAKRPLQALVVHEARIEEGVAKVGELFQLSVDGERRRRIRANHSATHLLHRALKVVLGDHVKQAGSVVAPDVLRFDYSHFAVPTADELAEVERLVNRWIRDNEEARTEEMGIEAARRAGAVALFGEKYGERVRVVSVHPESTELCGGTHVRRTGDIGLFKLVSDASIASGVRRIVAHTAGDALAYGRALEQQALAAAELLRTTPRELTSRLEATQKRLKELERKLEEATVRALRAEAGGGDGEGSDEVREVGGVKLLVRQLPTAQPKILRTLADQLRDKLGSGVVALGGPTEDGKAFLLVAATKDVVKRGFKAGDCIREMAKLVDGSGGGKPDLAQAGGADASKVPAALAKVAELLESQPVGPA